MDDSKVNHSYNAAELIQLYLGLRKRKETLEGSTKRAMSRITTDMELVERELDIILTDRISQGERPSIPTPFGTAFHQEQTKYILSDKDKLFTYFQPPASEVVPEDQDTFTRKEVLQLMQDERIQARSLLNFFTNAVAKKEIEQFVSDERAALVAGGMDEEKAEAVATTKLLPSGVTQSSFTKVSVRTAS